MRIGGLTPPLLMCTQMEVSGQLHTPTALPPGIGPLIRIAVYATLVLCKETNI
jgi:hypothetical protein